MLISVSEEHRLSLAKNNVLKTLFEAERDKSTGGRRQLHKENFHNWHSSQNVAEVIDSGL